MRFEIQVAEKLLPLITKPKRLKIAVGGRGGSKSIAFGDCFLKFCDDGEKLLCAREYQNSIDDSVHSLLKARMFHHGVDTLKAGANSISSANGGEIIYKGLARNVESIKSIYGVHRVWIEEGEKLSQHTVDILMPSIRESNSEIWISMNRGSSADPVSETFLNRYEDVIAEQGFYEDDNVIIVEINYYDNPWFPDVLNRQRLSDKDVHPRAKYDHIWLGKYSDSVDNAIIYPEWFDACVDAHKKLGFKATGAEVVSHDPADMGDAKGLAYLHGSILKDVQATQDGDVNSACDWAMGYAGERKVDLFIWDGDGLGTSLRRQVNEDLGQKNMKIEMFKGSREPYNPDEIYEPIKGQEEKPKTNKDTFANARAQGYWLLRDRMYRTWEAVEKGIYHDPSDLISFSSEISKMNQFRSEVCRIPLKSHGQGKIQLMSKDQMLNQGIKSPNMADSVMMAVSGIARIKPDSKPDFGAIHQPSHWMAA